MMQRGLRRGSSLALKSPTRSLAPCARNLYSTAKGAAPRVGIRHAVWVTMAGTALGLGAGLELLAPGHADDRYTSDNIEVQQLSSPTSNATFPIYRTREDVLYWMQYYYKHPEADLLTLAAESLRKDRMKIEDGWLLTGLLAGIVKQDSRPLSHYAVRKIYDVLADYRQALLVGLWLAGYHGKEHLEKLADEVPEEDVRQTIRNLLKTPPPDPLYSAMDAANFNMNLHVLLGMFYATGDTAVVDKFIDVCRDWSVDVLAKGGREGAARFYVAKSTREKLALLCQEHETARDACRGRLAAENARSDGGSLTKEQRTMLSGILEAVDRLEAEEKTKADDRKRRLEAALERAFPKEAAETR